jgi:pantetheine-phosphate adenylyltransferase
MPKEDYTYLSSRLVKEVFSLGGDLTGLVPEPVIALLRQRLPPSVSA